MGDRVENHRSEVIRGILKKIKEMKKFKENKKLQFLFFKKFIIKKLKLSVPTAEHVPTTICRYFLDIF
jgi:hypothetical protein